MKYGPEAVLHQEYRPSASCGRREMLPWGGRFITTAERCPKHDLCLGEKSYWIGSSGGAARCEFAGAPRHLLHDPVLPSRSLTATRQWMNEPSGQLGVDHRRQRHACRLPAAAPPRPRLLAQPGCLTVAALIPYIALDLASRQCRSSGKAAAPRDLALADAVACPCLARERPERRPARCRPLLSMLLHLP